MVTLRQLVQFISYYFAPIGLFIILYSGIINRNLAHEFSIWIGNTALVLLLIILFVKPVNVFLRYAKYKKYIPERLFKKSEKNRFCKLVAFFDFIYSWLTTRLTRLIISYRRELGVLIFWLAFWHSIYLMYVFDLFSVERLPLLFDLKSYFSWGLFALIGMFILAVTSNRISAIRLKRKWKKVQMLAYPVLALTLIHKAVFRNENGPYVLLGLYVIFKFVEFRINKKMRR